MVHDNKWLLFAGRQAFRSFVRAYATHSTDTKGIFAVQSVHLGHVAKSFGLRESPKALRSSEDVIAKIFNGAYSILNSRANEGNNRDRFKAGKGGKGTAGNSNSKSTGKGGGGGGIVAKGKSGKPGRGTTVESGSRKRSASETAGDYDGAKRARSAGSGISSTQNPGLAVKSGKDKQKVRKMGPSSSSSSGGSRSASKGKGDRITASGVFRKTTGYFKKKLRSQMTSEFSSH